MSTAPMSTTVAIDLRHLARGLGIPLRQVQAVVELLDDGNTVPFITRYRKDQTGGLDEEQIRRIQDRLTKARLLAERKQAILRSIESQGRLTEALAKSILAAGSVKRLEDLYLPYKPKKRTLATLARSRGLEPLAREILEAAPSCANLDARAADFVNPDRQVPTPADALLGAGHILAEHFSERAELRQNLREILQRTGRILSTRLAPEPAPSPPANKLATTAGGQSSAQKSGPITGGFEPPDGQTVRRATDSALAPSAPAFGAIGAATASSDSVAATVDSAAAESDSGPTADESVGGLCQSGAAGDLQSDISLATETTCAVPRGAGVQTGERLAADAEAKAGATGGTDGLAGEPGAGAAQSSTASAVQGPAGSAAEGSAPSGPAPAGAARRRPSKRELRKQKAEEQKIKAFRDYFDFSDAVRKIPPHRVLALNRGERARVLRVKIEADIQAMYKVLDEMLVPAGHPHAEFLRGCARDALTRLVLPSLERELRRELTERAEAHAVGVFAKNLRKLLLQPPVRSRRVLAVDPGLRSGCKLAALDQFGNVLGHDVIYLVGRAERRQQAREKVLELVRKFDLTVVAIGNGTGCRQAEEFFGRLIAEDELKARGAAYVIVNEAGASVYSTSRLGREEFPHYDAALRGAISIGRRLLDPLSELVKIDPPNIGVGLYQHDMKARHLRASLEEVVQSCVNYVGVDVNTASPALLRCVSGLNQLTARRVFEHRRRHGPFRSREQLREVPGVGEATFVQAAGFLKITGGSNPLDATWIHPESYPVATRVLEKLGYTPADLARREAPAELAQCIAKVDVAALASELKVGIHTLRDILAQLARPGRDPREDLPPPVFKHGILKLEDLQPGMELTGTVLNVVDFGAFVDIGMHDCGLVHVSRLADRFVRDPHDVVAVGDVVRVWVLEVDRQRRRVSLSMIPPGTQRAPYPRREPRPAAERRPVVQKQPASEKLVAEAPAASARADRPAAATAPPQHHRPEKPPPPARPPRKRGGVKHARRPLRPITEAMIEGKEPLRTFSDLLQLYEHKRRAEAEAKDRSDQQAAEGPAMPQPGAQQPPSAESPADQPPSAEPRADQPPVPCEPAGKPPGAIGQTTDQTNGAQAGQSDDAAERTVGPPDVARQVSGSASAAEHGPQSGPAGPADRSAETPQAEPPRPDEPPHA